MSHFVAIALTILLALPAAEAQVQSVGQGKCIGGTDKLTAKIVATQWKAARKCLSQAASGKLLPGQTAAECLFADNGGAVAKAFAKAELAESKLCSEQAPDFGHAPAAVRSAAATAAAIAACEDLFSADLGSAVIPADSNKTAAECQANVAKASGNALSAMVGEFLACKAAGLKDETIASASDLDRCFSAIDADAKGKIAKAGASLATAIAPAECSPALFPGACSRLRFPRVCRHCRSMPCLRGLGSRQPAEPRLRPVRRRAAQPQLWQLRRGELRRQCNLYLDRPGQLRMRLQQRLRVRWNEL